MQKNFTVEKYSVKQYKDDKRFLILTMNIFCSNMNANDSIFTDDALESGKDTFLNVPIVGKIKQAYGGQDFRGHELEIKYDSTGEAYVNYIEANIGCIPESANLRLMSDPNFPERKWLVVDALIWAERSKAVKEIFKRRKKLDISMEVQFDEWETKDGIDIVHKFTALAVCVLGASVRPGFKGAAANVVETFASFKQAVAFELKKDEKEDVKVFNMTVNKLRHKLDGALDGFTYEATWGTSRKYWIDDFDDSAVFVNNGEDSKMYRIPYEVENGEVELKMDESIEVEETYVPVKAFGEFIHKFEDEEAKPEDEEKVKEEFCKIEGFEYFGCGTKAAFGFKDGAVYAFPYQYCDGIVTMEAQGNMCGLSAKYSVTEMGPEEKGEDVVLDVPAGVAPKLLLIEEFSVDGKFAEKFSAFAEMGCHAEEYKAKFEDAEKRFEELSAKYEAVKKIVTEAEEKQAEETFCDFVEAVFAQYSGSESFNTEWKAKAKEYMSQGIEAFKKDYVYQMVTTNSFAETSHMKFPTSSPHLPPTDVDDKKMSKFDQMRKVFKTTNKGGK